MTILADLGLFPPASDPFTAKLRACLGYYKDVPGPNHEEEQFEFVLCQALKTRSHEAPAVNLAAAASSPFWRHILNELDQLHAALREASESTEPKLRSRLDDLLLLWTPVLCHQIGAFRFILAGKHSSGSGKIEESVYSPLATNPFKRTLNGCLVVYHQYHQGLRTHEKEFLMGLDEALTAPWHALEPIKLGWELHGAKWEVVIAELKKLRAALQDAATNPLPEMRRLPLSQRLDQTLAVAIRRMELYDDVKAHIEACMLVYPPSSEASTAVRKAFISSVKEPMRAATVPDGPLPAHSAQRIRGTLLHDLDELYAEMEAAQKDANHANVAAGLDKVLKEWQPGLVKLIEDFRAAAHSEQRAATRHFYRMRSLAPIFRGYRHEQIYGVAAFGPEAYKARHGRL
ncbi:hypothetical protein JCM10908_002675 [Rhodotorula pacifica]|uniref:uncharacterized protein n=1 Tax=Rhodotorula pacifica TaxID=1495444 RepID=UPI00317B9E56